MRTHIPVIAALVALAAVGPAAGQMSLLYDEAGAVERIAQPPAGAGPGLGPERGAFRQDPGAGGLFTDGDDAPYRVAKVSSSELMYLTAAGMAAVLRREISEGSYGAASHLVAVDEIGKEFGEAPPSRPRRGMSAPPVSPSSPGARLAAAMRMLDTPSPWGGTWASRVHLYVAPAVHTAIGKGRGRLRNLGRDGKPHFRTWRALMRAVSLSGGAWLEMYHAHSAAGITPLSAGEWRRIPRAVLGLAGAAGASPGQLHFLFTGHDSAPPGAPAGCGAVQACTWRLAESTDAGSLILASGPGAYRVGDQAGDWLREFNRRFD